MPSGGGATSKILGLVVVLVLACALPFLMSGFRVFQFTQVYIYAIALLGLNILTGYNGQISLGHGAFYAIGAYTTAIMIDKWSIGYGWTIPTAGILCLVVGFLFGRPALRLEGLYLALATFSLALAVPQILKYFEHWTGGSQGIVLSKPKAPWRLPINEDQWLYFLTLAILIVLFVLARNLLRSRSGRAIVAIRDNHIAAEAMGINSSLYKSFAFGVSAAYTGIAGALSGIAIAFVAPVLQRLPLHHPVDGGRHRRASHHLGRHLRRPFHPVRAKLGPGNLQGCAVGHLWHLSHRVHVRDAARDRRLPAARLDPNDAADRYRKQGSRRGAPMNKATINLNGRTP
jgi:branched-chain amino acid transport system permease protein